MYEGGAQTAVRRIASRISAVKLAYARCLSEAGAETNTEWGVQQRMLQYDQSNSSQMAQEGNVKHTLGEADWARNLGTEVAVDEGAKVQPKVS